MKLADTIPWGEMEMEYAFMFPSNIRYPQDFSLLNEAREKLEGMIDYFHEV